MNISSVYIKFILDFSIAGIFNNKIFRRSRVGYEIIDTQRSEAIIISYPTSASGIIVFIKKREIFLDLSDVALQEQPEGYLMVATPRANNDSYTTAAKPMKSLELHYTMI